jgi:hypothetical protein
MRNQYIPADLGAQMSPAMGNLRKFACKWAGCSTGFSSLEGLQQHMQVCSMHFVVLVNCARSLARMIISISNKLTPERGFH